MIELKESLTFRVSEVAEILQISDDKTRRLMHEGWMRVTKPEMLKFLAQGTDPSLR